MTDARKSGCFLCNGPHQARDCSTKGKISAMVAAVSEDKEEGSPGRAATL